MGLVGKEAEALSETYRVRKGNITFYMGEVEGTAEYLVSIPRTIASVEIAKEVVALMLETLRREGKP